jgi:hypothetical protein
VAAIERALDTASGLTLQDLKMSLEFTYKAVGSAIMRQRLDKMGCPQLLIGPNSRASARQEQPDAGAASTRGKFGAPDRSS